MKTNYVYLIVNKRYNKLNKYHYHYYVCYNNDYMKLISNTCDLETDYVFHSNFYNFNINDFNDVFDKYIINDNDNILLKVSCEDNEEFKDILFKYMNDNGFFENK